MRKTKAPEERKKEILDTANELFSQKGFDDTSVNDILERIGIAKGTFYYYFKSKEEVMDALVERCAAIMFERAKTVAADKDLGVHEKIFAAVMALNMRDTGSEELLRQMHKPQNALMHEKSLITLIEGATPILAGIVREGIEAGLFDTPCPEECVEMIITYTQIAFDDQISSSDEDKTRKIAAFINNIERLLGTEKGAFAYVNNIFNGDRS